MGALDVQKLLWGSLQELYRGDACLKGADQKQFKNNKVCRVMKEGKLGQLIQGLYDE